MKLPSQWLEFLPTPLSRWTAGITLVLSGCPFLLQNSLLTEMWLSQETIWRLLQLGMSAVLLSVGLLIVLTQVIYADRPKYRRELIGRWRKMVADVASTADGSNTAFALERHEAFYSLKPHLSQETIREIYSGTTWLVGATIPAALPRIQDEIARLEKKWGVG